MKKVQGKNGGTLTVMEKGESLPGCGHPGGANFKTIARKFLDDTRKDKNPLTKINQQLTNMERVVLTLMDVALNSPNDQSKIAAIREILDRLEGKVSQGVDLSVSEKAREIASMFPTIEEVADYEQGN